MKKDRVDFVSKWLTCQQVKTEHQRPNDLLQCLPIPKWKQQYVITDFVIGLPRTSTYHNVIWVIVDTLAKSTYFLLLKASDSTNKFARLYLEEIVRLHCIPFSLVSDKDPHFISRFWKGFRETLYSSFTLALRTIHKLMASLNEPFRYWRTCYGVVY